MGHARSAELAGDLQAAALMAAPDAPQAARLGTGQCLISLDLMEQIKISVGAAVAATLYHSIGEKLAQHFGPAQLQHCPTQQAYIVHFTQVDPDQSQALVLRALNDIALYRLATGTAGFGTTAYAGLAWQCATARLSEAELARRAVTACAMARQVQKSLLVYDVALCRPFEQAAELVAELPHAMQEGRLQLLGQEILTLGAAPGQPRMFEVLLQLVGRDGQVHSPAAFIPQAERSQLIEAIDRWVIGETMTRYGSLLRERADLALSLNLSGRSLSNPALWPYIQGMLLETATPGAQLHFEVTETGEICDMTAAAATIKALQGMGCRVVLDDFGAGLSGYRYLKELGVNGIKIDGSLIPNVTEAGAIEIEIIRSIVVLAHNFGLDVVAEHVSTYDILVALRQLGIRKMQGYAVAMPQLLSEVLLAASNR